jgi:hypothetical protein
MSDKRAPIARIAAAVDRAMDADGVPRVARPAAPDWADDAVSARVTEDGIGSDARMRRALADVLRRIRERGAPADDPDRITPLSLALSRGIPEADARALVAGGEQVSTIAIAAIRAWWGHKSERVIVLSGPTGVGKSYAAARALLRARVCTGYAPPRWLVASHLGRAVASHRPGPVERRDMADARASSLLVLDEMGDEDPGYQGATHAKVRQVLTDRISGGMRTIVTTNLDRAAFDALYGERLASRVDGLGSWTDCSADKDRRRV